MTAKVQGDNEFLAPVIYISPTSKTDGMNHLDFLNDLMGHKINDNVYFKLRLWYYWKYFFKYDYYKEEEEVRLLLIDKDKGNTEWSEEFNMPFHFISKKTEEMPFNIIGVTFDPKYRDKDNYQKYISDKLGDSIEISHSKIIGYR